MQSSLAQHPYILRPGRGARLVRIGVPEMVSISALVCVPRHDLRGIGEPGATKSRGKYLSESCGVIAAKKRRARSSEKPPHSKAMLMSVLSALGKLSASLRKTLIAAGSDARGEWVRPLIRRALIAVYNFARQRPLTYLFVSHVRRKPCYEWRTQWPQCPRRRAKCLHLGTARPYHVFAPITHLLQTIYGFLRVVVTVVEEIE